MHWGTRLDHEGPTHLEHEWVQVGHAHDEGDVEAVLENKAAVGRLHHAWGERHADLSPPRAVLRRSLAGRRHRVLRGRTHPQRRRPLGVPPAA